MKKEMLVIWLGLFVALGLFFQNCSNGGYELASGGIPGASSLTPASNSTSGCFFNGQELSESQAVTAYLNSTPEYTNGCISETRTCKGGVLDGTFTFSTCSSGPKSCLFNGITILSGDSVRAYSEVSSSNTCDSQVRKCTDGVLSGSLRYSFCGANCLFNGISYKAGDQFYYYPASTASACERKIARCQIGGDIVDASSGALLNSTQIYGSCTTQSTSCNFGGTTLGNGQSFTYYVVATSTSCSALQGTCQQGQLKNANGENLSGSQIYPSCPVSGGSTPASEGCAIQPDSKYMTADRLMYGPVSVLKDRKSELIAMGVADSAVLCYDGVDRCTINRFYKYPTTVTKLPPGTKIDATASTGYLGTCYTQWWDWVYAPYTPEPAGP